MAFADRVSARDCSSAPAAVADSPLKKSWHTKQRTPHHETGGGGKERDTAWQSKQRRLARQAAAEEARRLAEAAEREARALTRRRVELASLNGTLREMITAVRSIFPLPIHTCWSQPTARDPSTSARAGGDCLRSVLASAAHPQCRWIESRLSSQLELERAARMRLQEVFARDWTMQSAALKRVFHEQVRDLTKSHHSSPQLTIAHHISPHLTTAHHSSP